MQIFRWPLAFALLLAPTLAYANFFWPPMLYLLSFSLWWVVAGGLLIEGLVHGIVLRQAPGRTIWLTIGTNLASAILGTVVMLPFLVETPLIDWVTESTMLPVVIVIVLFIPVINIAIEYWTGTRLWLLLRTRRTVASFVSGNILSFGLVLYGSLYHLKPLG